MSDTCKNHDSNESNSVEESRQKTNCSCCPHCPKCGEKMMKLYLVIVDIESNSVALEPTGEVRCFFCDSPKEDQYDA
jgi:hypothetical protein